MRGLFLLAVTLLVSSFGLGASTPSDATVIEYTSPVGGSDAYCPSFGNFPGAVAGIVRGMSDVLGVPVRDPVSYCGEIPPGTTSVDISIVDDHAETVVVTVSQLDADNEGSWTRFCDAATVPIDPESVTWTLHVLPYGQTSQLCMDAGVPTHGFVTLAWS